MTQNGVFSHKSKQVQAIHHQLISDFLPAIKNIASAGQNLFRAHQNLSRNHYVYTASLCALAFSTTSAGQEQIQKEHRKQLEQITEAMKTIYSEQNKWVEYFAKMIMTISRNCEHEKERLKALQNAFSKRERELSRAVDRGKKAPAELDNFYDRELVEMRDQQVQRYQFFVGKHLELLRHYFDWMRFSMALLEREFDFGSADGGGTESSGGGDNEQGHLDELMRHAERMEQKIMQQQQQQNGQNVHSDGREGTGIGIVMEPQQGRLPSEWNDRNGKEFMRYPQQNDGQRRGSGAGGGIAANQQLLASESGANSPLLQQQARAAALTTTSSQQHSQGPEMCRQAQQQGAAAQPATVPGLQRQRPQQGLFRPIPVLPEQQQKFRHSLAEGGPYGVGTGNTAQREVAGLFERQRQQQQQAMALMAEHQRRREQLRQFYSEGPPADGEQGQGGGGRAEEADGRKVARNDNKNNNSQFQQMSTRALGQPQQYRQQFSPSAYRPSFLPSLNPSLPAGHQQIPPPPVPQKMLSPLVTAGSHNFSAERNQSQQHVRGLSQESTASSGLTAATPTRFSRPFTPPIFISSDYGRLVECTTPYEAQGDNQLSLDVGEQVVLVKSGTRGWVLGRSEDASRQGWFPAKYLKLV